MVNPYTYIKQVIKLDVESFINSYDRFNVDDLPYLNSYYKTGDFSNVPKSSLSHLSTLIEQSNLINDAIRRNKYRFGHTMYNELFDILGDIEVKLETYKHLDRWNQLDLSNTNFQGTIQSITTKVHETAELASQRIGYGDRDNGAIEMMSLNKLSETDYMSDGGVKISYSVPSMGLQRLKIDTLVGPLNGTLLYGKDLTNKLEWDEDGDLKSIKGFDCFYQTCDNLVHLLKNNNPEYPQYGIDKSLLGNTLKDWLIYLPIIFKDMKEYIGKDDTIKNMYIKNVRQVNNEGYAFDIELQSQLGENTTITYSQ